MHVVSPRRIRLVNTSISHPHRHPLQDGPLLGEEVLWGTQVLDHAFPSRLRALILPGCKRLCHSLAYPSSHHACANKLSTPLLLAPDAPAVQGARELPVGPASNNSAAYTPLPALLCGVLLPAVEGTSKICIHQPFDDFVAHFLTQSLLDCTLAPTVKRLCFEVIHHAHNCTHNGMLPGRIARLRLDLVQRRCLHRYVHRRPSRHLRFRPT